MGLIEDVAGLAPVKTEQSAPRTQTRIYGLRIPGATPSSNGNRRLDVARWLSDRGVEFRAKAIDGATAYLVTCAFDSNHGASGESAVFQGDNGKLTYDCKHNSCQGRRWADYRDAIGKPDADQYDPPLYSRQATEQQQAPDSASDRSKFEIRVYSSAELDATRFEVAYFVDYMLAKHQPAIVAAPQKALKTTIAADLLLSIASGDKFLGEFPIATQARCLFMSGESGFAVLQETARRICESKGRRLAEIENLWWTEQLPQFGNAAHIEETRRIIRDRGIELLTIDPCYLAMPGGDAANLFIQGALLREMASMCREEGCSLLIVHHTKMVPKERQHEPLELSDIAFSGFQEFVRQWFLINRRTIYEPGSGSHELWLNVGSSVGHGGLWAVDANEGVLGRESTRYWDVAVTKGAEAREQRQADRHRDRLQQKKAADETKMTLICDEILNAFSHFADWSATKTKVRARVGQSRAFDQAWLHVCNSGDLVECKVRASNGQEYDGYKRVYRDAKNPR